MDETCSTQERYKKFVHVNLKIWGQGTNWYNDVAYTFSYTIDLD
jgi:hypothetical protein